MKKELEPLLIDANQVRQLTGLTVETLRQVKCFPHPVRLDHKYMGRYGQSRVSRNLWKRSEVETWIKNLEGNYSW